MAITRRSFGGLVLGGAAATVVGGEARAASAFVLGATRTLSYSGAAGELDVSIAAAGDGSVRIGFAAHTPFLAWQKAVVVDFTATDAATGTPDVLGKGDFATVSAHFLRLPSTTAAVYVEKDVNVWFQALSATGAPSGVRKVVGKATKAIANLAAIELTNGKVLVVWLDTAVGRYVGQLLAADGSKSGATFDAAPGADAGTGVVAPIVACALASGAFATAYRTTTGALLQRFNASGGTSGAARKVETATAKTVGSTGLTRLPSGDILAVYGYGKRLRGRRFTAAGGSPLLFDLDVGVTVSGTDPTDGAPRVVVTDKGDIVVVFQASNAAGTSHDIQAIGFTATGVAKTAMTRLFSSKLAGGMQLASARVDSLVAAKGGQAVVGWSDGIVELGYVAKFRRLKLA